jgi:hypothetical protein
MATTSASADSSRPTAIAHASRSSGRTTERPVSPWASSGGEGTIAALTITL